MPLIGLLAVVAAAPAYIVLQVAALVVAHFEGWRLAFMAPLFLSVPIGLWCLAALAHDSNLWPVSFLIFAPFGAAYLLALLILRAILPLRRDG
jgi:hypothetical protein